jgi:transposase
MPNPYPTALRERAVRAYETSTDTYAEVAARFAIGLNTLLRWVQRARATGDVTAFDKRGGWQSPVDLTLLHRLVREKARPHDRRIDPRVQPRGRPRCARASLECVARAAADGIRLQKKRSRPAEEAVREAQEYMSVPNLSSAEGDVDLRIRGL